MFLFRHGKKSDNEYLVDESTKSLIPKRFQSSFHQRKWFKNEHYGYRILGFTVVFASVIFNILLSILLTRVKYELYDQRSHYARMNFDTVRVMSHHGPYGPSNHNETARAILWENLDGSSGQVAMAKSWAGDNNLPETQDFAWDRSKGVYSLRGFHGQHCLRKLYRWVAISYHNGTQLDEYEHVVHCLDALLQDVRCWADDTPMVFTPRSWGEGQQRQCRDWGKLKAWAKTHNACFAYVNETQGVKSMFDRYKWCPEGSQYSARMRSLLKLSANWSTEVPKDIDSLPPYWELFGN